MTRARASVHAFAADAVAAGRLAEALKVPCRLVEVHTFPDGEILPVLAAESRTVIIYCPLDHPNEKLVALALAADAARRAGAERVVLVAPYLCYMRQDKVFHPGEPISQAVIGGLLGSTFDRVVTVDAHLHRIARLFAVVGPAEADDLSSVPAVAAWLRPRIGSGAVIVGPDAESEHWARPLAAALELGCLVMRKTRRGDREVTLALDDPDAVKGRQAILVDDIVSTGSTMAAAIGRLKAAGAVGTRIVVTHGLFAAGVIEFLRKAGASEVISTDSVVNSSNAIGLAGILAAALGNEIDP